MSGGAETGAQSSAGFRMERVLRSGRFVVTAATQTNKGDVSIG